jgi:PHP family Zn ribbon phosphoesterase
MSLYYDLHIHSCLSPCADEDMTPMNIAGMAHLKKLDVIALTDHNCGFNLVSMKRATEKYDILFVPGIETTTAEEVHLLSYFKNIDNALEYADIVYNSLPDIPNTMIFGSQTIVDDNDEPSSHAEKLLAQSSSYTLEQLSALTRKYGGAPVPAHITRPSFALVTNLGYIPDGLFSTVELYRCKPYECSQKKLCSSDSHSLFSIHERRYMFDNIYTINDLIDYIA